MQSAVFSRLNLLNGKLDVLFLFVIGWSLQPRVKARWLWAAVGGLIATLLSAMTPGVLLLAYMLTFVIGSYIQQHFWKQPSLAMLAAVFIGVVIIHLFSYVAVSLISGLQPVREVLNFLLLPSLLLNILCAFPVYLVVKDMASWLYPEELKV